MNERSIYAKNFDITFLMLSERLALNTDYLDELVQEVDLAWRRYMVGSAGSFILIVVLPSFWALLPVVFLLLLQRWINKVLDPIKERSMKILDDSQLSQAILEEIDPLTGRPNVEPWQWESFFRRYGHVLTVRFGVTFYETNPVPTSAVRAKLAP